MVKFTHTRIFFACTPEMRYFLPPTFGVLGDPSFEEELAKFEDFDFDFHHGNYSSESIEDQAKRDFGEFDKNADGLLDVAEIRAEFKGLLDEQDLDYFFRHADSDTSGTIDFPEYLVYVKAETTSSDVEKTEG
jgi:Ca2+-binding EF-hand superfamily protein